MHPFVSVNFKSGFNQKWVLAILFYVLIWLHKVVYLFRDYCIYAEMGQKGFLASGQKGKHRKDEDALESII